MCPKQTAFSAIRANLKSVFVCVSVIVTFSLALCVKAAFIKRFELACKQITLGVNLLLKI